MAFLGVGKVCLLYIIIRYWGVIGYQVDFRIWKWNHPASRVTFSSNIWSLREGIKKADSTFSQWRFCQKNSIKKRHEGSRGICEVVLVWKTVGGTTSEWSQEWWRIWGSGEKALTVSWERKIVLVMMSEQMASGLGV